MALRALEERLCLSEPNKRPWHRRQPRPNAAGPESPFRFTPRADPYIVFSIDPPSNPGCKIFRRGGYFGRKTKTDVQLCTLNPFWEEAFNPLSYLGTRSELENEILRVRVYDWDLFSSGAHPAAPCSTLQHPAAPCSTPHVHTHTRTRMQLRCTHTCISGAA